MSFDFTEKKFYYVLKFFKFNLKIEDKNALHKKGAQTPEFKSLRAYNARTKYIYVPCSKIDR